MKKFIVCFLVFLSAHASSNKTHLSLRPSAHHTNLYNPLWSKQIRNSKTGVSFKPIATFSDSRKEISRYFTFDKKLELEVGRNKDIDNRHLKFDETSTSNLTGKITFAPKVETYGIRADFHQNFDNFFIEANTHFIKITSGLRLGTENQIASTSNDKTIENYFNGDEMLTQTGSDSSGNSVNFILQQPLRFGKIKRLQDKVGPTDVNLILGYRLSENDENLINGKLLLNFPTTTSPSNELLFEPTLGSAGTYGFGIGFDGVYNNEDISVIYNLNYKYLFADDQMRILGLKNQDEETLKWGQYMLVGKIGRPLVMPAANILHHTVEVTPGSQLEGLLMISVNHSNLVAEAGYNFWFHQREHVKRTSFWDDNEYGFVSTDYQSHIIDFTDSNPILPQNNFSVSLSNLDSTISNIEPKGNTSATQGTILSSQLDPSMAETPSAFTHKLFITLGVTPRDRIYAGVGASYEFATSNSAIDDLSIWSNFNFIF